MRLSHAPWSFRSDPAVPRFDAPDYFTVMDAHCGLCARGATWIARRDTAARFRIVPVQSELGAALLRHYGIDPHDPHSWLYVRRGEAFTSLAGVIEVAADIGGIGRLLIVLRILPARVQDRVYRCIARNRYRLGGRADLCATTDPDVRARLLR